MGYNIVLILSLLAIANAQAQYYQGQPPQQSPYSYPGGYAPPAQPQPYYQPYQPYPAPPQQPSRADYGRSITVGQGQQQPQAPSWPYPYFPQQPGPNFPPQSPEPLIESIFKHEDPDMHRYLTPPSLKFKIGIVAEKIKDSNKDEDTGTFKSYIREGHLYIQKNKTNPETPNITLEWEDEEKGTFTLESGINFGGKGFELATLNVFNGKLYACDDETGVVYELKKIEDEDDENKSGESKDTEKEKEKPKTSSGRRDQKQRNEQLDDEPKKDEEEKYHYVAQPWIILSKENSNEGFKCKWGVVRNNQLWIGSTGSLVPKNKTDEESTETSKERQIVKQIDPTGEVTDVDFSKHYEKLAEAYEVNLRQGHVVHEAAAWSDLLNKWIWAPKRVTKDKRDNETWNKISTNEVELSDDKFEDVTTTKFGNLTETVGFKGLRFIPGTQDRFVLALKAGTDEEGNYISTLAVYDLKGTEIMPETKVADGTYSAVEFL